MSIKKTPTNYRAACVIEAIFLYNLLPNIPDLIRSLYNVQCVMTERIKDMPHDWAVIYSYLSEDKKASRKRR